jgi:neutral amino acid transport system permease protein
MLIYLLVRSPWGRVLRGIRDDEHATRSLGKNVFAFKLQSLVLGGSIGALAGILLAVDAQFTNADYWQSIFTFFAFTVIIIGGVGRVIGPVVGSMLFWFLLQGTDTLLQQALADSFFGSKLGPTEAGPIRFALVGLVLMLLMIFRPQGLFGSRAETLIEER